MSYENGEEVTSLTVALEKGRIPHYGYFNAFLEDKDGKRELFQTYCSSGPRECGNKRSAYFFDQDAAIYSFLCHFNQTNSGIHKKNIYWRIKPTMNIFKIKTVENSHLTSEKEVIFERYVYEIYTRLILSDDNLSAREETNK